MKAKLYKSYNGELGMFYCELVAKDFPLSVAKAAELSPFIDVEDNNTAVLFGDVQDVAIELAYIAVFHPNECCRNIFVAMEESMLNDKDVGDEFNAEFNAAYRGFSK
jgi:hypothetical protein